MKYRIDHNLGCEPSDSKPLIQASDRIDQVQGMFTLCIRHVLFLTPSRLVQRGFQPAIKAGGLTSDELDPVEIMGDDDASYAAAYEDAKLFGRVRIEAKLREHRADSLMP